MARQDIDIGVEGNDGTGDSIRESFRKVNENFRELYALFGLGGQLSFTDLGDTPNTYVGNETRIPVVKANGTGLDFLELSSDNLEFNYDFDSKLIEVVQISSTISTDSTPVLGGPLNAATFPIGNIDVSQTAVDIYNNVHDSNITLDDLVINKRFADRFYQPKFIAGGGIRLGDEPADVSNYTKTADSPIPISANNLKITGHGYNQEYTGSAFIFESSGTSPTGLVSGNTYYIRVIDENTIGLFNNETDAINNTNKIEIVGGTGTFTITDAAYDETLTGNWLSNVAIPRKSIVRRQGDTMEGTLFLNDHPGDLSGFGIPNGEEDLQAATKLYVDAITPSSDINLYVSTSGSDNEIGVPADQKGRTGRYAFRTINAATRKAEEIIVSSPVDLGPYVQTVTHTENASNSEIVSVSIDSDIEIVEAKNLLTNNLKFISKEAVAYVDDLYPNSRFDRKFLEQNIEYIIQSISLDMLTGLTATNLSRNAGIRFFYTSFARKEIAKFETEIFAAINYAKTIVNTYILQNTDIEPQNLQQTDVTQYIDLSLSAAVVNNIPRVRYSEKFDAVIDVLNQGPLDAVAAIDGPNDYAIEISNGNNGAVDQGGLVGSDIIPGKLIRGKLSKAVGEIIRYIPDFAAGVDKLEIRLLESVEFIEGEELEYANKIKKAQITVKVESGLYEEDLPIRVPQNVSIVGDEFRRSIVGPKNRISQSTYNRLYFYRDAKFDGLVLGRSDISEIGNFTGTAADPLRIPHAGVYTIASNRYTTDGRGKNAEFQVTVAADGAVTVEILSGGTDFCVGDTITIADSELGDFGAADVVFEVNKVPNGVEYINPLTGTVDGYFGYHYLEKPGLPRNIGNSVENLGEWTNASSVISENRGFIKEQVVNYLEDTYPALVGSYKKILFEAQVERIIDNLAKDLILGGVEFTLESQGEYFKTAIAEGIESEVFDAYGHIYTVLSTLFQQNEVLPLYGSNLRYTNDDVIFFDIDPAAWQTQVNYKKGDRIIQNDVYYRCTADHISSAFVGTEISNYWEVISGPDDIISSFVNLIRFAFDEDFNPPLNNRDCDVFLMNDSTILRNISVQGQGGFMVALDPEGQILTKSPYIQTGSSLSASVNKQSFRGGMYIDAFSGNSALQVTGKINDAFTLAVKSEPGQGLFLRKPQTPCPFYIEGRRFQVNAIRNYDPSAGTAELILDRSSNNQQGFTGNTSGLINNIDLDSASESTPIDITLQTAGNRSMLGNDFTQINDLGYGLVVVNGGLSEMVSMFTYYCWTSYYSKNGSQIRSLTGSSCYGEYGLIAEGADPNEIPDDVFLLQDMTQPAKTFAAEVILKLTGTISSVTKDDVIAQGATTAKVAVSQSESNTLYLYDAVGVFNTTNELTLNGNPLGANSVPYDVDSANYISLQEGLSIYVYDMKDEPLNRGEFDIYHSNIDTFARYEVANVERVDHIVGRYEKVNGTTAGSIPATVTTASGVDAVFNIRKTTTSYAVDIVDGGSDYAVNDTFEVDGALLGGVTTTNNAVITVVEVDGTTGAVLTATITGVVATDSTTPVYDGQVYKLNFSSSDQRFSINGLLDDVEWNSFINYRRNRSHLIGDIINTDTLTFRPSTAVVFDENPDIVYRSTSFINTTSLGTSLGSGEVLVEFDESYDYIVLPVNVEKAINDGSFASSTTLGATQGDTVIALDLFLDENEIERLNNNSKTNPSLTNDAPIFTWAGKKHYVYNYRQLDDSNQVVPLDQAASYAIVDIEDYGDNINTAYSGTGIADTMVLGNTNVTLRAGLPANEQGDVTVNISTCRATGHDFLDVGTGGYNQTNYPNVIFGPPAEITPDTEVEERGKGRVFYVSTDQDGVFRVGRFFSVDQGTGTITFASSIAITDADGLGFKRGTVVKEFSTDNAMTDNASDTVPTESAVRGYVNRRLGFDLRGNLISDRIGPGVVPLDGSIPMVGNLNMGGNNIVNLRTPEQDSDAATKLYVDGQISTVDSIEKLNDVVITTPQDGEILIYDSGENLWKNYTFSNDPLVSDITIIFNGTSASLQINNGAIIDSDISDGAAISQDKLDLLDASDTTKGIASFNSSEFTVTNGNVSLATNGITISKLEDIGENQILGRTAAGTGPVSAIDISSILENTTVLDDSDFITTAATNGDALIKTGDGTYGITNVTTTGEDNSIVKTTADGKIQASGLVIGNDTSYEVLTTNPAAPTTLVFKTPGQGTILTAVGTTNPTVEIPGSVNIGGTGVGESVLQTLSNLSGQSRLGVDWIYSSFIEAPGEKDASSTGLSVGASTGFTTAGEIGIVVANDTNNTSVLPFKFSVDGVVPDQTDTYDIGTSTLRYNNIYAASADVGNLTISGNTELRGNIDLGRSASTTIDVKGVINSDILPDGNNTRNIGSATANWNTVYATLFSGTALEAYYADLAENYLGDWDYEPGTVLVFGGDYEVTVTNRKSDHRVAGVVTTNPAQLMNSHLKGDHVVGLALQGRVPCKVIGQVEKGDILVTSAIPGYAIVDNDAAAGRIIGKALENKTDLDRGIIEVVVGKH